MSRTGTISITDEPKGRSKKECFDGNSVTVLSRSGLHPVERVALERFRNALPSPRNLLVAGNRTGVTAMFARRLFPECRVTSHAFDLHHVRAIARNLAANGYASRFFADEGVRVFDAECLEQGDGADAVRLACTAYLPPAEDATGYDAAVLLYTPGLMTAELLLDQLEDIHARLAPGGRLLLVAETPQDALLKQLKAMYAHFTLLVSSSKRSPLCVLCEKRGELAKPRDFHASFTTSVPGQAEPLMLISLPGVFCHRRADAGGLALAEVATDLLKNQGDAPRVKNLLDMGCGCGLVGLLIAANVPVGHLAFLDSHARALKAAKRNAAALGVTNVSFTLSDNGAPQRGYDLFVGNPPYYSEYRIADIFLEGAHGALRRGGSCLTVAKAAGALARRQEEVFGNVLSIPRRGYTVLKSTRS